MSILGKIFSPGSSSCLGNVDDALIVDVRTPNEFREGHVDGSINVPLDQIESRIKELENAQRPLILCCASGMRSGRATTMLRQRGVDCCNGGSWVSVHQAKTNSK